MNRHHFIGERVTIGGRCYVVRALLPDIQGLTVESVDGFTTDVDAACVDDEPPSFRRVEAPGRQCRTCSTAIREGLRCNYCYETETRLDDYLRRGGKKALQFVLEAVHDSGLEERCVRCDQPRDAHVSYNKNVSLCPHPYDATGGEYQPPPAEAESPR